MDAQRGGSGRLEAVLRNPDIVQGFSLRDWDLFVRQARRAGLLARIAVRLKEDGLLQQVPEQPRHHLESEAITAEKHARDVRWEVASIKAALAPVGIPVILLKGAAYVLAGLPPAKGRLFNDIDFLVPKDLIETVEGALNHAGWASSTELAPYDDRYYRDWMHQIPPLTHFLRQTTIDVHHTIIPETVRLGLKAEKLFAAARPVAGMDGIRTLAPADMILHSATHLLNEGEFDRGLRDLDDMNLLLRHFGADPAFWPELLERAAELDLRRPLYYALRYTAKILATPLPDEVGNADRLKPPNAVLRRLMDALFDRALRPDHPSCRDSLSGIALWLLYVRSHHLRLPPHLLVPHLVRKAYIRRFRDE